MQEELELDITDLSRGGAGLGRDAGGRVVFVPFTAPGDRVRARIIEREKRFAQAELLEVLTPSMERVSPRCPVFGRCGGCLWQHLPYERQWRTKVGGLRHVLERAQVTLPGSPELFDELPAEQVWEYRNRVQLRGFGQTLGFHARASNEVVAVDRCDIARPEINGEWGALRREGSALPRPYKVEVEVLPDGAFKKTWNAPHAAGGFRQVHDAQNEKLVAWVRKNITPGKPILDLFGGAGNLSLPLIELATEIDCVDLASPSSTELPPGLSPRYRFHRTSVISWLLREAGQKRPPRPTSAILDPPRAGLAEDFTPIAEGLATLGVTELVAVGCDPDSWARDVSRFVRRGWRLERVGVLDFFPQTPHVEALAVLRL